MKRKMPQSGTLNINAIYNNGQADAGVSYSIPVDQQDVATVDSNTGVVTSNAKLGTATVTIKETATQQVIGNVTIRVVSAEEWALEAVDHALVAGASTADLVTLVSASQDGFAIGDSYQSGEGDVNGAFNGLIGTNSAADLWVTAQTFSSNTNAWLGRIFPVRTQIKRVRVMFCTAPTQVVFQYTDDPLGGAWTDIGTPVSVGQYETFTGNHPNYTVTSRTWQEYDLSSYPAAFAFRMKCHTTTPVANTIEPQFTPTNIARLRVWEMELYKDQATFLSSKFSKNDMTQNEQSGYKAFACPGDINSSAIYSNALQHNSYQLFDGIANTISPFGGGLGFGSNYKWYAGQVVPSQKKIKRYSVQASIIDGYSGTRAIRKWVLQGSQDTTDGLNGTWTDLDTQDISSNPLKVLSNWNGSYFVFRMNNGADNSRLIEKRYFELPLNNTLYTSYRLVVIPRSDGENQSIAELEFYEA